MRLWSYRVNTAASLAFGVWAAFAGLAFLCCIGFVCAVLWWKLLREEA